MTCGTINSRRPPRSRGREGVMNHVRGCTKTPQDGTFLPTLADTLIIFLAARLIDEVYVLARSI